MAMSWSVERKNDGDAEKKGHQGQKYDASGGVDIDAVRRRSANAPVEVKLAPLRACESGIGCRHLEAIIC